MNIKQIVAELVKTELESAIKEALADVLAVDTRPAREQQRAHWPGQRKAGLDEAPIVSAAPYRKRGPSGPRTFYVAIPTRGRGSVAREDISGNDARVMAYLDRHTKPVSAQQIQAGTGLKPKAVESSVQKLATVAGYIARVDSDGRRK